MLLARQLYLREQFKPTGRFIGRLLKISAASAAMAIGLYFAAGRMDEMTTFFAGRLWVAVMMLSIAGALAYGVLAFVLGAVRLSDYKAPVAKTTET